MAQTNVLNRMQWKYQAWLNGFNGGPMRQPSMRVTDPSMATLRQGLAQFRHQADGASGSRILRWPQSDGGCRCKTAYGRRAPRILNCLAGQHRIGLAGLSAPACPK